MKIQKLKNLCNSLIFNIKLYFRKITEKRGFSLSVDYESKGFWFESRLGHNTSKGFKRLEPFFISLIQYKSNTNSNKHAIIPNTIIQNVAKTPANKKPVKFLQLVKFLSKFWHPIQIQYIFAKKGIKR